MKRLLTAVLLLVAMAAVSSAAPYVRREAGGAYMIEDARQLKWFRDAVNGGETGLKAVLVQDIDLGKENWPPIGFEGNEYSGSFDGGEHVIRGLYAHGGQFQGLFGCIGMDGFVGALEVERADIACEGVGYAGAIAGRSRGRIVSCQVSESVVNIMAAEGETGSVYSGAIVGQNDSGSILDCLTRENLVTAVGMYGYAASGGDNMAAVDNNGSGDGGYVAAAGGICGASIEFPGTATAGVTAVAGSVYGTDAERRSEGGLIMDCEALSNDIFASGGPAANVWCGGIAGFARGGVVGQSGVSGGGITAVESAARVVSLGGIAGASALDGHIDNCWVEGGFRITSLRSRMAANIGGVAGQLIGSSARGCFVRDVALAASGSAFHYLGGISGQLFNGGIADCRVESLQLPVGDGTTYAMGAVSGSAVQRNRFSSREKPSVEKSFFLNSIAGGKAIGENEASIQVEAFSFAPQLSPDL